MAGEATQKDKTKHNKIIERSHDMLCDTISIRNTKHVTMKSSCVFAALVLVIVSLTLSCHGQIHYTPDWGHGKRSLASQFGDSGTDSTVPCLEQTELNLLLEVAKLLTREAKRLSNCLKDCPSLE